MQQSGSTAGPASLQQALLPGAEMNHTLCSDPQPVVVASLLGHPQVKMAVTCLGSLMRFSADPIVLRLHDDGSLAPEDINTLQASLGAPEIVDRRNADRAVEDALSRYPALRRARAVNPLFLKLLDAVLLADGDVLRYCDTDVLFLKPFTGLLNFPDAHTHAIFMSDHQNAYSIRSWQLLFEPRLRPAAHVNSGIILFSSEGLDLDYLEWFLADPHYHRIPVWLEQTCWALLAQRVPSRLFDARQLSIPNMTTPSIEAVALHFVSPVRSLLEGYAASLRCEDGSEPTVIRSQPTRACRISELLADELGRALRRVF